MNLIFHLLLIQVVEILNEILYFLLLIKQGIVPDVYDTIVLYCAGGFRSIIAADTLVKMGYKNVLSLKGGIGKWKQEGNSIVNNTISFSDRVKY